MAMWGDVGFRLPLPTLPVHGGGWWPLPRHAAHQHVQLQRRKPPQPQREKTALRGLTVRQGGSGVRSAVPKEGPLRQQSQRRRLEEADQATGAFRSQLGHSYAKEWFQEIANPATDRVRVQQLLQELLVGQLVQSKYRVEVVTDALMKRSMWEGVQQLAQFMDKEEFPASSRIVPYNALMVGYKDKFEWEFALDMLDYMRSIGLEPNSYSYQMAINASSLAGEVGVSRCLLQEMRQQQILPKPGHFMAMMEGISVSPLKSQNSLHMLEDEELDIDQAFADLEAQHGLDAVARRFFEAAPPRIQEDALRRGASMAFSGEDASSQFIAMMKELYAQPVQELQSLAEEAERNLGLLDAQFYSGLMAKCEKVKRYDLVLELYSHALSRVNPDTIMTTQALTAMVQLGEANLAQETIDGLVDTAKPAELMDGIAAAIAACMVDRKRGSVLSLIDIVRRKKLLVTYPNVRMMLNACSTDEETRWLRGVLDEMDPDKSNAALQQGVLVAASRAGEWQEALNTLKLIQSPTTAQLCQTIGTCSFVSFGWELALNLLKEGIRDKDVYGPKVCTSAATTARMCSQWEASIQLIEKLDSFGGRRGREAYSQLLAICTDQVRNPGVVAKLIQDIRRDVSPRARTGNFELFRDMLTACMKSDLRDEAIEVVRETQKKFDEKWQSIAIQVYEEVGLHDEAIEMYRTAMSRGVFLRHAVKQYDDSNIWEIDVHYLSVEVAKVAVREALDRIHWMQKKPKLLVNCGRGRGSDMGIAVVRPALVGMVERELGLRVSFSQGAGPKGKNQGMFWIWHDAPAAAEPARRSII